MVFLSSGCGSGGRNTATQQHDSITRRLIVQVDRDPVLKRLLTASIGMAARINPDSVTNPVRTLEQYYDFIDRAARALPWTLLQVPSHTKLYERMDQGLAYFYFINDQPLEELSEKGYYRNTLQYHEPYRTWLLDFVRQWGLFLSTGASWSEEMYRLALADERFGLDKGWYEDPSHWSSFNDFFSRKLSSPGMRPVAAPGDPSVISSPCDATPFGIWKIDGNSIIESGRGVPVKSTRYASVGALLGPDCAYKEAFAGGIMTFAYLDEYDYHRCHAPVDGTILEARILQGGAPSGGITTWDTATHRYLFQPGEPGWQSLETRGCVVVEAVQGGLVALIPVGMSQMGSVVLEESIRPGQKIKKGDPLCHYLFGGSGFVMLFRQEAGFRLTAPLQATGSYRHILAGEEVGRTGKAK